MLVVCFFFLHLWAICFDIHWFACPNSQAEKDQRLIYFGKLLLDHMNLKDVLTQVKALPVFYFMEKAQATL